MNRLDPALADYLRLRRALGYKLDRTAKLLAQFTAYLDAIGAERVTVEAALAWATQPVAGGPSWLAGRLTVVRGFAAYLHAIDPANELVPTDLLPDRGHRATPYLYSRGSSPCGSDMSRSTPPRSTCTPTLPSRSERWPEPRRRTRSPAATGPPTRSSPSSTGCDYADLTGPGPSRSRRLGTPCRHNPEVGLMDKFSLKLG
ncbi:hypothetical protein BH20CHL7_BH20CHL7_02400 [soil metagenome]